MRYVAQVAGVDYDVQVQALADGQVQVAIDGEATAWRAQALAGQTWLLHAVADGAVHTVGLASQDRPGAQGPVQVATCAGGQAQVQVLDPRQAQLQLAAAGRAKDGPMDVHSPMPGRVVAILVADGQAVAAGQALMVIEAMKMENEVRAGRAGKVANLSVQLGDCPDGGARLCTLI